MPSCFSRATGRRVKAEPVGQHLSGVRAEQRRRLDLGGHAVKACDMAGQSGEALILFDDALQIVERTGVRWLAAELKRHKGRLLIRQGHSEAAERLYRKALNIAREQEAKLWELRAAVSLARLRDNLRISRLDLALFGVA